MAEAACDECGGEGRIMRYVRQSFDQLVSCPCQQCYDPRLPPETKADRMTDTLVKQCQFPKFRVKE